MAHTHHHLPVKILCTLHTEAPPCPMPHTMAPPPTLLPFSTSASYTTSIDPSSPKSHARRLSSPPRSRRTSTPKALGRARSPTSPLPRTSSLPRAVFYLLRPRVISSLLLWSLAIYLLHHYLLPLPVPSLNFRLKTQPAAADHFLSTTFPTPPLREGNDWLDSVDPRYRPFLPLQPPDSPFPRLRPTRFLPPRCLEQWFSDGETLCGKVELGEEEKLDATWLWVNGTDERWRESMLLWREREGVYSPEHHFRQVDLIKGRPALTITS